MAELLSMSGLILSGMPTPIVLRLERVKLGNLGDYRSVGEGERGRGRGKGKGERRTLSLSLTLSLFGLTIVLLLCGGDKSSQAQDIRKAQEYWIDYRS